MTMDEQDRASAAPETGPAMDASELDTATRADGQPGALLPPLDVDDDGLRRGVAAVLFVADEPLTVDVIAETLGVDRVRIASALAAVGTLLDGDAVGVELREVAGGWRLMTASGARTVLERWIIGARHGRLTQAALETLAVVAYRQPITRTTIGEIRGVNPDGALRSLIARGLVTEVAREDGPGQAVLFGTTAQFLERMGLRSLDELPPLPPYLPDGPAPDEPDASGLSELRRRLRDGSERLGSSTGRGAVQGDLLAGAGAMQDTDEDDDAMAPPTARVRTGTDGAIVELSDRLEQAARSAMGRLRSVRADQARAEAAEEVAERAAGAVEDDEPAAPATEREPDHG
jgi:segregation and condensation protein B